MTGVWALALAVQQLPGSPIQGPPPALRYELYRCFPSSLLAVPADLDIAVNRYFTTAQPVALTGKALDPVTRALVSNRRFTTALNAKPISSRDEACPD